MFVCPSTLHPHLILTLVFLSALPLIAHVDECFLCSGELNSCSNNPTAPCMHLVVPLVLYKLSLPSKAALAWWNGHVLLQAATVHVEHTQPPQLLS